MSSSLQVFSYNLVDQFDLTPIQQTQVKRCIAIYSSKAGFCAWFCNLIATIFNRSAWKVCKRELQQAILNSSQYACSLTGTTAQNAQQANHLAEFILRLAVQAENPRRKYVSQVEIDYLNARLQQTFLIDMDDHVSEVSVSILHAPGPFIPHFTEEEQFKHMSLEADRFLALGHEVEQHLRDAHMLKFRAVLLQNDNLEFYSWANTVSKVFSLTQKNSSTTDRDLVAKHCMRSLRRCFRQYEKALKVQVQAELDGLKQVLQKWYAQEGSIRVNEQLWYKDIERVTKSISKSSIVDLEHLCALTKYIEVEYQRTYTND